jgi:hypothetical protein
VRRIISLLTVTALMMAMLLANALPAFAAAPKAGCPEGFVEKEKPVLPPGTKGIPSTSVNETTQECVKELENAPQPLKDLLGTETVEVVIDDVVRER